jgi:DNA invertase Pin-like site-specific DNA recombinase
MRSGSGDVLAVWRLDRLGRSLKHLIELMAELEAERIGFQSITESIDTSHRAASWCFIPSGR